MVRTHLIITIREKIKETGDTKEVLSQIDTIVLKVETGGTTLKGKITMIMAKRPITLVTFLRRDLMNSKNRVASG